MHLLTATLRRRAVDDGSRLTTRTPDDQPKKVATDLIAGAVNAQPNDVDGSPSNTTDLDLNPMHQQMLSDEGHVDR